MLQKLRKFTQSSLILGSLLALAACGGGGDGGGGFVLPGCAGTGYTAMVSYPATLSGSAGAAVLVSPTTNAPAACSSNLSFTLAGGSLPAGLTLNPATGVISGTPTSPTSTPFAVALTVDGYPSVLSGTVSASIAGCAGAGFTPSVSYPSGFGGSAGTAFNTSPTTNLPSACVGSATFALASGSLPAGLTLNPNTGVISGTASGGTNTPFAIALSLAGYTAVSSPSIVPAITGVVLPKWTVMVYIAGDNSLSEFALADLAELRAAANNPEVKVVVQMEYSASYPASSTLIGGRTYRGLVPGNNAAMSLTDLGASVDMSNKASLTSFINYAKTSYPAQNYSLVLWSHGNGWRANKMFRNTDSAIARGALNDDSVGTAMSLIDIKLGITNAMGTSKLGVLAFDACLMGQYEVAYELRNTANYLVASEELVPGPGMPYTQVINTLSASAAAAASTPLMFANNMTSAFNASYLPTTQKTTMSVVDLATMDTLHTKLLDFSTASQAAVAGSTAFATARTNALSYGGTSTQSDSVDLWKYANDVAAGLPSNAAVVNAANALKAQINTTVKSNLTTSTDMAGSKGLAIYLPPTSSAYQSVSYTNSASSNTAVSGKKTWAEFLSTLYTGASTSLVSGANLAYYVTWTAPAGLKVDLDLAVNEPRGNWAAPWIGSTSPNALLSGDSNLSSQNFESYTAQSQIETGSYDVFANLYGCATTAGAPVTGSSCSTTVSLYSKGSNGAFSLVATRNLNQGNLLGGTFYNNAFTGSPSLFAQVTASSNPYSDWTYFGRVSRGDFGQKSGSAVPKIPLYKSSANASSNPKN